MRSSLLSLAGLVLAFVAGCSSKSAPPEAEIELAPEQSPLVPSRERTIGVAKQMRGAMTDPSLMKLTMGSRHDFNRWGFRGFRQIQAAQPYMRELVECGKLSERALWQLLDDADESVRQATVILLNWRNTWNVEELKFVNSHAFLELTIPLLEFALSSKDANVRFWACEGLGDYAYFSDECLERLKNSLPKLRELRNDEDKEVRRMAYIAYKNMILGYLSTRARQPEDREAAAEELQRMQGEKEW